MEDALKVPCRLVTDDTSQDPIAKLKDGAKKPIMEMELADKLVIRCVSQVVTLPNVTE